MGEIADMMLNGDMCEGCGEYLGDGDGFTVRCAGCQEDYDDAHPIPKAKQPGMYEKGRCRICDKLVFMRGMNQHVQAKHGKQPKKKRGGVTVLGHLQLIRDALKAYEDGPIHYPNTTGSITTLETLLETIRGDGNAQPR